MRKIAGVLICGFALALPSTAAVAATSHHRAPVAELPGPPRLSPRGTGEPIAALNAISADGSLAVGADSISTFLNPLCGTDLSERRGATGFSAVKTPSPSCGWLDSVVSLPRGRAWAVGYLTTKTGATRTLTEYYTGTRWVIEPSPSPAGDDFLDAVAVTRSGTVWAVGSNPSGSLIYKRTGSSWTRVKTTLKIDLHALTVTGSGQVWAAGDEYNPDLFSIGTAIVHLTSSGWKQVPSPNPGQSNGRDRPVRGRMGGGYTGPRCERNLVEHYTAGAWHVLAAPNRGTCPDGTNAFYGIAVTGRTVYAVGQAGINALAEKYTTGKWTILHASN